ncbi:MAG TPA: hypothetical protein VLE53_12095 [Gemmatimonadaceae bacterium]|nr:hypothetical protein [Gemmatimonadaceae bacterium]
MRSYVPVFLLIMTMHLPAAGTGAQAPDPAAAQAGIARLDFMVGRWRGPAWQQRGAERVQTQMLEVVERKLGGAVLLVEGRGTVTVAGAEERVVHHALGVVSFDPASGTYTLRSYLATGQWGDFTLTLIDGGVQWTREVPGGRVRNTARYTKDEWHEIGEFSRDGTTWMPIMELRLRREP